MSSIAENNKRIAKNTLFLYFRMLLTMAVSLYTSRVILQTLGVEDYGIYNVVGGVIAMLSFLNGSLSGASSRFITYELGKGSSGNLKEMFSTILCIHFILAIIILILGESVGLWFVYNKLVIPAERMNAALWVYHCSILTAIISIISVPYNSLIIAHEKMNAFAYISIVEVILKLVIVWMLTLFPYDKLIIYAILYLIMQFLIRMIYNHYCTKHFKESRTMPTYHPKQMKDIFIFACWTMNGNLAILGYTQGINILLNLFFGPIVNAARGIAVQVQSTLMTFVHNFLMAVNPQIIKSCAIQDYNYVHQLVITASKYGFFLMMIISFPFFLMIEPILKLWLGVVPDHTASFVKIMLYAGLLTPLCRTLVTAINATGNIKKFQIYEGTSLLMIVPIAYLMLKMYNISPEGVMWIYIGVEIITQIIRMFIVLPMIEMSIESYFRFILSPLLMPFSIFLLFIKLINIPTDINLLHITIYSCISCLLIMVVIILFGLNKSERFLFKSYVVNYFNKFKR